MDKEYIKCVSSITNGIVKEGFIYYLENTNYELWKIYDMDLNYLCPCRSECEKIPRGFIHLQKYRDEIIDDLLNN